MIQTLSNWPIYIVVVARRFSPIKLYKYTLFSSSKGTHVRAYALPTPPLFLTWLEYRGIAYHLASYLPLGQSNWNSTVLNCFHYVVQETIAEYLWNHGCPKAEHAFLGYYYFCSLHCVLLRRLFKSWAGNARAKEKNKRSWKRCGGQGAAKQHRHEDNQECSW